MTRLPQRCGCVVLAIACSAWPGSPIAQTQVQALWLGQWTARTGQPSVSASAASPTFKLISLDEISIGESGSAVTIIGRSPLNSEQVRFRVTKSQPRSSSSNEDSADLVATDGSAAIRVRASNDELTIELLNATGGGTRLRRHFTRAQAVGKPGPSAETPGGGAAAGAGAGGGGLSGRVAAVIAGSAAAVAGIGTAIVVDAGANDPPCEFSVSPSLVSAPGAGTTVTISVNPATAACADRPWTATNTGAPFLVLSAPGGTGSGTLLLTVLANTSGSDRTGNVMIAGQRVVVNQSASICTDRVVNSEGTTSFNASFTLDRDSGSFEFRYDSGTSEDQFIITYEGRTLFDSGCIATGSPRIQVVSFSGSSAMIGVMVNGNCARRTEPIFWQFAVACPR